MIKNIFSKIKIFLLWTEKWTQTDMIYFSRGGFWLGLNQAISMFAAFLLSIAFANLLTTETYGSYKYILSIVSLLSIPTLAGMGTSITQAVARGYEGTLISATKERMRWGLISSILSIATAGYYYYADNYSLTYTFLIAAIFLPLMDPLNSYSSFLSGKKLFKDSARYNVISQITILAATGLTLYATQNLFIIILVYFISRTVINAALTKYTLITFKPSYKVDLEAISYGKHLTAMNIIGWIAAQLDKILIWHYLGAIELAVYSFAMAPIDQINSGVLKNIITLAFPKFSSSAIDSLKKTLPKKIIKFTGATIAAAIIFVLIAPLLYHLFFPQYLSSVQYARFYAITLAILPISLFNTAITAQSQKKKLYFLSLSSSSVKIILLLVLLPIFGITGAIAAIIGSTLFSNVITYYLFKKM